MTIIAKLYKGGRKSKFLIRNAHKIYLACLIKLLQYSVFCNKFDNEC